MAYNTINILILQFCIFRVYALPTPSYISEWKVIKSQSNSQSEIVFYHGLNEVPVKVHTEVKVPINKKDFIFPGMGSASTDDDKNKTYGGVLTTYNGSCVTLYAPNVRQDYGSGFVLYTGNSGWIGPSNISREYSEANVRVRVWIKSDFPSPDFQSSWQDISVKDNETFRDIQHDLNDYPTFAVVQIKAADSYYFEAQGSTSREEYVQTAPEDAGGVIYGFSDKSFRIWYPKKVDTGSRRTSILCISDGWGTNSVIRYKEGQYRILAWKFQDININSIQLSRNEIIDNNFHSLPLEMNSSFVNVEVESTDGVNNGYIFYGVGSTVNDGDRGPFGGLIFAYSDREILFWIPNGVDGHLIKIGGIWGPQSTHHSSDNVTIRINILPYWVTEKTTIYQVSESHSNILPSNDIIWTKNVGYTDCARSCTNDMYCNSFFYHSLDQVCFGYSNVIYSSGSIGTYSGLIHYINLKHFH